MSFWNTRGAAHSLRNELYVSATSRSPWAIGNSQDKDYDPAPTIKWYREQYVKTTEEHLRKVAATNQCLAPWFLLVPESSTLLDGIPSINPQDHHQYDTGEDDVCLRSCDLLNPPEFFGCLPDKLLQQYAVDVVSHFHEIHNYDHQHLKVTNWIKARYDLSANCACVQCRDHVWLFQSK